MRKYLLALAAILAASPLSAQEWTTGPRPVVWVDNPTIGDGIDRGDGSTVTQGGTPPAYAFEPVTPNEDGAGPYVRSQWLSSSVRYTASLQPKFRISCNVTVFGTFDPVVYPGVPGAGHHHTFVGAIDGVDVNTTSESLRTRTTSSACMGGPLNKTLYWEPTLFYEQSPGILRPVKANVVSKYYTMPSQAFVEKLTRLPMGLQFIGGVNPDDFLNTNRLAEIPDGQGWLKTRRYDGWGGWGCYNGGTLIPATASEDPGDGGSSNFSRRLVNADGSDPWAGACENPNFLLIANLVAPSCWDGYNLKAGPGPTSVTAGRDHFRYAIYKAANQNPDAQLCPNGWWKLPSFEVKTEFPNGRPGIAGHAWRSKLFLSSDRMSSNPANWRPRGSTFHFDFLIGWDTLVLETWQRDCLGMTVKGVPGADGLNGLGKGNDCDAGTISPTQSLAVGPPPVAGRSNNPIITFHNYAVGPTKNAFGPIESGTAVSGTVNHAH